VTTTLAGQGDGGGHFTQARAISLAVVAAGRLSLLSIRVSATNTFSAPSKWCMLQLDKL
jgi:hypothetical protein